MSRRRLTCAACFVILAAGAAMAPVAAAAHAILISSQPAIGAAMPAGRVAMVMRYNSRIDARRSRLTLTRPDGNAEILPIGPPPAPDVLTTAADLAPGAYSLRWQVLAIDGHITRGDVPFTVTPTPAATPPAVPPAAPLATRAAP